MLFSNLFAKTIKDSPKDALLRSHSYLIRGAFIHQVGSGVYNFLPLGNIVLENIKKIIRENMNRSGANEVIMGFLTPASLWKKSGRYSEYGEELAIFKDRKNNEFVLGPTHEECASDIINTFVKSYKQLPINLYQMHLKFRDELRPRSGLLRAREFIMKDAYSFHENYDCLSKEFNNMLETYINIFNDLDLDYRVLDADSGAIGGSGSKEFSVLSNVGEDTVVMCQKCEYAANIEAATRKPYISDSIPPKATKAYHKFKTPGITTIKKLSNFFNVDEFYLIKTVVKKVVLNHGEDIAVFFIRGRDQLENTKALNAVKKLDSSVLGLEDASVEFLEKYKLEPGFIGPIYIKTLTDSKFIIFDNELMDAEDLICGANENDYHFVGVNLSEFSNLEYSDLIAVNEGDLCPECGGQLKITNGIEVGHIFKLGDKYSKAMDISFLDKDGKSKYFEMGCYGIGVTRLLCAILEQKSDDKGCVWGKVAPFKVDIIISNVKNQQEIRAGFEIYDFLKQQNISVILDDRIDRFGTKINDFELIGFSYAVIIGNRLKDQTVEIIRRDGLEKVEMSFDLLKILEIVKQD